jgi:chorismate mutase
MTNLELETLREKITLIDNELLEMLEDRIELAKEIAEVKIENNIPIEDLKREEEVIKQRKMHTSLDGEFVESLMKLLIQESKKAQNKILGEEK